MQASEKKIAMRNWELSILKSSCKMLKYADDVKKLFYYILLAAFNL